MFHQRRAVYYERKLKKTEIRIFVPQISDGRQRKVLQLAQSDRVSKMISIGDGIQKVNEFFRELDIAVEVLRGRYNNQRSKDSNMMVPGIFTGNGG